MKKEQRLLFKPIMTMCAAMLVLGLFAFCKPITVKASPLYLSPGYPCSLSESDRYIVYKFDDDIDTIECSDDSILDWTTTYRYLDERGEEDYSERADDGYVYMYPMKAGTVKIKVTGKSGGVYEDSITITSEDINAILTGTTHGCFIYPSSNPDETTETASYHHSLYYGNTSYDISARYGTRVTLKIGSDSYSATANIYGHAIISKVKVKKIGTKASLTMKLGDKTVKRDLTVKAGCKILPDTIKSKSKKGTFTVYRAVKGDVIKVKRGSKTIKKITVKKSKNFYDVSFSTSKMKKGTKLKYYVYNKYGQKRASKSYKVGTQVDY